jgi:hypothetical protein
MLLGWLVYVLIMNSLEINIAIFICCIPATNTLFRRFKKQNNDSYDSPEQNRTPENGKVCKSRDPLDSTASQSDHTSNTRQNSHREPSLNIAGAAEFEGVNRTWSPREYRQDLEKMG